MSSKRTFIDLVLVDEASTQAIDDYVDAWHANPDDKELHEYLGMTSNEYSLWLRVPDALLYILKARRNREPLTKTVSEAYEKMRLGSPGNDMLTAGRLHKWLKEKGVLA